jgi:hypothetical protein
MRLLQRGTGNSHIPHRRHEKFGCILVGCVVNATKTEKTKERFYEVRTTSFKEKQISIEARARDCISGPVSVQSIGPELIQSLFQTYCFNPSAMTSSSARWSSHSAPDCIRSWRKVENEYKPPMIRMLPLFTLNQVSAMPDVREYAYT